MNCPISSLYLQATTRPICQHGSGLMCGFISSRFRMFLLWPKRRGILSMCPCFISSGGLWMRIGMGRCLPGNLILFWVPAGSSSNSRMLLQEAGSMLSSNSAWSCRSYPEVREQFHLCSKGRPCLHQQKTTEEESGHLLVKDAPALRAEAQKSAGYEKEGACHVEVK